MAIHQCEFLNWRKPVVISMKESNEILSGDGTVSVAQAGEVGALLRTVRRELAANQHLSFRNLPKPARFTRLRSPLVLRHLFDAFGILARKVRRSCRNSAHLRDHRNTGRAT